MFHTILPHYRHVKPIVQRYETLYAQEFPLIKDWHVLGKLILIQLIASQPEILNNPLKLQLTFRITLVKALSLLPDSKVEFA